MEKGVEEKMNMLCTQINELKEESGNCAKNVQALRQYVKELENKTDEIIASQTYLSAEYDELLPKIKISLVEVSLKAHNNDLQQFNSDVLNLAKSQNDTSSSLEHLEQYGKRDNLELHGVSEKKNDNVNYIVKTLAKKLNIKIDDCSISTAHRLPMAKEEISKPS